MQIIDALISWNRPIPGTLRRYTGEDNRNDGRAGGHHYEDTERLYDSMEGLARKDPTIGHENGTFDEAGSSEVANVADEKWNAEMHGAGSKRFWIDIPEVLSKALLCSINAGGRE